MKCSWCMNLDEVEKSARNLWKRQKKKKKEIKENTVTKGLYSDSHYFLFLVSISTVVQLSCEENIFYHTAFIASWSPQNSSSKTYIYLSSSHLNTDAAILEQFILQTFQENHAQCGMSSESIDSWASSNNKERMVICKHTHTHIREGCSEWKKKQKKTLHTKPSL